MINRLNYIDSMRGFAMLCVVVSHTLQRYSKALDSNLLDSNLVFHFVESFQMPLFMFICGFVAYREIVDFGMVKKAFFRLFVPNFVWLIIGLCISMDFSISNIWHSLTYPHLWFLWALFFIQTFFCLFSFIHQKLNIRHELAIAGGGGLLIGSFLILHTGDLFAFDLISYHFTFFSIGFFVRKYKGQVDKALRTLFWICLPLFILLFMHHKQEPPYEIFGYKFYSSIVIFANRWITGFIAIPVFYYLFKLIGNKVVVLQKTGMATMGIYILHFFFLSPITYALTPYFNMYIVVIVSIALNITICYYITIAIRRVSVVKTLLLGEKS